MTEDDSPSIKFWYTTEILTRKTEMTIERVQVRVWSVSFKHYFKLGEILTIRTKVTIERVQIRLWSVSFNHYFKLVE